MGNDKDARNASVGFLSTESLGSQAGWVVSSNLGLAEEQLTPATILRSGVFFPRTAVAKDLRRDIIFGLLHHVVPSSFARTHHAIRLNVRWDFQLL
jgi:hypothetical protein